MRPRSTALALALVTCILLLLAARTAGAHAVGLSKGDYTAAGTDVYAELTFARGDLVALVSGLDANGDGAVDARELARAQPAIEAVVLGGIAVEGDGAPCRATLESATLAEPDGVDVRGRYRCASPPSQVRVRVQLLEDLPEGHRHVARSIVGSTTVDDVLRRGHEDIVAAVSAKPAAAAAAPAASVVSFLRLGIEHILTGWDHLVFLFGLVLIGGRLRSLVGAVTAFTVAHSITLALAVLGVWAPSPRIVEPAIALSIVWVGIENFFVRDARGRWRITFPFGLVHGFGFAGALREIELPRARVPAALVTFNLGVEVGQLAVMALVVPAIVLLRKRGLLDRTATLVLSAGVVAAGAYWFITRVVP